MTLIYKYCIAQAPIVLIKNKRKQIVQLKAFPEITEIYVKDNIILYILYEIFSKILSMQNYVELYIYKL